MDSQVALGALIKGRSSSAALNSELARSLPHMVCLDLYLEGMYFNTLENRADQPTRGKEIEGPKEPLPAWWEPLSRGDTQAFDLWLYEHGLDDLLLSGLPPLSELCGEVSPPGTLPGFLRQELQHNIADASFEQRHEDCADGLPSSTSSARPLRRTADFGRPEASPGARDEAEVGAQVCPKRATGKRTRRRFLGPELTGRAAELLQRFPRDQFVLGQGVQWPPKHAGFLDLYSGKRGVAKGLSKLCPTWSLCFDLADSPSQDLSCRELQQTLEELVTEGAFLGLGGGPVCASFSMAVRPPVRDSAHPYGKTDISENMQKKVEAGNLMSLWFFSLLEMGLHRGLAVWLENPSSSWMFRLPAWRELVSRWKEVLGAWCVDYCRFGKPWRKRTKFFTNTALCGVSTLCKGGHIHQQLKGYSRKFKMSWTKAAEAYPDGVAESLSYALAMQSGLLMKSAKFNPADCSHSGHMRIGEAKNPGPRPSRTEGRNTVLQDVSLVEPRTKALQCKIWEGFLEWLALSLSRGACRSAMEQPLLLVYLAREYGNFLFSSGKSLFVYRHFLVFLQQNFVTAKPYMSICWSMVAKWEILEPTIHRVPLPWAVFRAMLTVSLGWGWKRFAAILLLAFHGIARPGEPLAATRNELVLPRDTLDDSQTTVFLKVLKPKTRRRGKGVVQHISVQNDEANTFLDKVFRDCPKSDRLYACSGGAFRRRWDAVLRALCIPASVGLTPGGLRGGGCVHAFQTGADIPRLLWKMRISTSSDS